MTGRPIRLDDSGDGLDDPWLISTAENPSAPTHQNKQHDNDDGNNNKNHKNTETKLSKAIHQSKFLRTKLQERARVVEEGLLLTVPFRTVEEYLTKLKMCATAIKDLRSLGLIYLAAAVSDFYIPHEKKALHKIQSRNYGLDAKNNDAAAKDNHQDSNGSAIEVLENGEGIVIRLSPVPKCISFLRKSWAPDAFCVSFKLETNHILRDKARMTMD